MIIEVGARSSPLSQAQVKEVLDELKKFFPHVEFKNFFVSTQGDNDQKTSLRILDKTNFFTKEIDDLVLEGTCRIGIHSAKDLPEPIPNGLQIAALTKGLDSADVCVLRMGDSFDTLPPGSIIATSSDRRESIIKSLRPDFKVCDLRGTIHQRLAKLETGEADGIVVAEAALIRLGLTHLNKIRLPGETALYQGKLAIVTRLNDHEMLRIFACLDSRIKK